jgi:D-amino-acid dehydrogenase
LADIVSGRVPEVDFAFQGMAAGRGANVLVPAAKGA